MRKVLTFTVKGKPQAKQRPRRGHGGRFYTPQKTLDYEENVKASFLADTKLKAPIKDAPLIIRCDFYFKVPKSYTKKRKTAIKEHEELYTKKPDVDNLIKAILDGLNGVAYEDDNQVVGVTGVKHYAKNKPYTKVWICTLDKDGYGKIHKVND